MIFFLSTFFAEYSRFLESILVCEGEFEHLAMLVGRKEVRNPHIARGMQSSRSRRRSSSLGAQPKFRNGCHVTGPIAGPIGGNSFVRNLERLTHENAFNQSIQLEDSNARVGTYRLK